MTDLDGRLGACDTISRDAVRVPWQHTHGGAFGAPFLFAEGDMARTKGLSTILISARLTENVVRSIGEVTKALPAQHAPRSSRDRLGIAAEISDSRLRLHGSGVGVRAACQGTCRP